MKENTMEDTTLPKALHPLLQTKWHEEGFTEATSIQNEVFQPITEGEDVIAESPTGTGKTLAYVLPILQKIEADSQDLQVMILAPSHELVMQIHQVIVDWGKELSIRSASFIGGGNVQNQKEKLKKKPHIIVGSPGRVAELIKSKKMKVHNVRTIVIDEVDQLVSREHLNTIQSIIQSTLKERQLLFFSATVKEETEKVGNEMMKSPKVIRVKKGNTKNVEYQYIQVEQRDKVDTLRSALHALEHEKILVFVNEITKLGEIEEKLLFKGVKVATLASDAKKQDREKALKLFRQNEVNTLMVTDVAARGLDIQNVTMVLMLDLPRDYEQFVHRSGRTGRMGKSGQVLMLTNEREVREAKQFSKRLGCEALEKSIYGGKLLSVEEQQIQQKVNKSQARPKPKGKKPLGQKKKRSLAKKK
ncbi:RNA helicase [Bacillus coahuilensis p1.1.43]|uniref:RNA helicase n=2 Tax=Bacillus coahuilensis TaxID=408580 RepID=A0A147KC38_9BACI|nr:RNA helicase [Bacillus coahuilensis p1.1.43]